MRSSLLVRPGQRAGMAMGALRLAHVSAPASAVHEHRLLPVHLPNHPDPVQTEVIAIAATTDKPEYQVLVLPGNPGNAGYYRRFMSMLHTSLNGKAHVISCSHAGHDLHHTERKLWSIEEQILHKVNFIRQHLLLPGRPPLVILAHSVGSYMAVHAVHRLEAWLHSVQQFFTHSPSQQSPQSHPQLSQPQLAGSNPQPNTQSQSQLQSPALSQSDTVAECVSSGQVGPRGGTVDLWHAAEPLSLDGHPLPAPAHTPPTLAPGHGHALPPVHKVVAMMPFLQADMDNQIEQRFLRFLSRRYRTMSAFAGALCLLPEKARLAFVRWWTNDTLEPDALHTTIQLVHPKPIKNNFYMAHTEFRQMSRPFQWDLFGRLGSRVHVMACPRDPWMSEDQYREMCERLPELQATWHEDLEHAFCVSDRQTAAVAQHVASILQTGTIAASQAQPTQPTDTACPAAGGTLDPGSAIDMQTTSAGANVSVCATPVGATVSSPIRSKL